MTTPRPQITAIIFRMKLVGVSGTASLRTSGIAFMSPPGLNPAKGLLAQANFKAFREDCEASLILPAVIGASSAVPRMARDAKHLYWQGIGAVDGISLGREPKAPLVVEPGCGGKDPNDEKEWPARLVRERAQIPPAGGGGRRLRHLHARSQRHHYQ